MGVGVKAVNQSKLKAEKEKWESINKMKMPEPKTKKTIKDYEAETKYYKDIEDKRKAKEEKERKEKEEAQAEEEEKKAEKEKLKQKRVEE